MGLQSALSTALTGLNAAETIIDVAGNNVANSQTVGFKESSVNFATQFLQTVSIGSPPSAGNGGTNPRQIGLGVKVAEIAQDFTQGTIEISSNPLDVAIQGDGFLIVQSSAEGGVFYTRNGQLKTNRDNELVTVAGDRVLGWNAVDGVLVETLEPLVIPIGGSVVNRETSVAAFSGTLDPNADVGVGAVIESSTLGNFDIAFPDTTDFTVSDLLETPVVISASVTGGELGVAGNLPQGTYSYRISYYDAFGETAASDAFTIDQDTVTDDNIELTNLPAAPSPYTGVRVYRAVGTPSTYRLVGETTTTSFTDSISPVTLAAEDALNTDTVDNGNYGYYITYYRSVGDELETRPSALVGTRSITESGHRIRLEDIPPPTATGYDRIRIYRNGTGINSGNYFEVADIPGTQDTFIDSTTNADLILNEELDLDGVRITEGDNLSSVQLRRGSDYVQLFDGPGVLRFTGVKDGTQLPTKELTIRDDSDPEPTTVREWLDFIEQSLGINPNEPNSPTISIVDGNIVIESNSGIENAIDINSNSFVFTPTGGSPETIDIPFEETTTAVGAGSTSEFVVYDSLGIPVTVQLTTVMEEKNDTDTVWRWFATSGDNEPGGDSVDTVVGTGTIVFDKDGVWSEELSGDTTVTLLRNVSSSDSPLSFELDFSQMNGKSRGFSRIDFETQDGFAPGVLSDFNITESGEIRGVYSNGVSQTLGQILMAKFRNNNGLEQVGNNLFAAGVNSGDAKIDVPGSSGLGELTAGAVELSNTDIGQNLIELILASTQYRGGARVITAVQELLDELLALRR
jgi:flagellar hook protein FlgE